MNTPTFLHLVKVCFWWQTAALLHSWVRKQSEMINGSFEGHVPRHASSLILPRTAPFSADISLHQIFLTDSSKLLLSTIKKGSLLSASLSSQLDSTPRKNWGLQINKLIFTIYYFNSANHIGKQSVLVQSSRSTDNNSYAFPSRSTLCAWLITSKFHQ